MTTTTTLPAVKAVDDYGDYDGPTDLAGMKEMAEWLAGDDGAIPDFYVGHPMRIGAAMLQAKRLKISVMTALDGIYYTDGKVCLTAGLILHLMFRGGCEIRYHRTDNMAAIIEIVRRDGLGGGVAEWHIGEAVTAGLIGTGEWDTYRLDCLRSRCVARGARMYATDLTGGSAVYLREERRSGYADGGDRDVQLAERVVTDAVAQLLDGVDGLAHKDLRKRWLAGQEAGLLNDHAGVGPTGVPITAGGVLMGALERSMPSPKAKAGPVGGVGLMRCGCDPNVVIATGEHEQTCADRPPAAEAAAPAQATVEIAPVAVPAAVKVSRRGRVLAEKLSCGCRKDMVDEGKGHRKGCAAAPYEDAWTPLSKLPPVEVA